MYSFQCDYSEGALPEILETLQESNLKQSEGYGEDSYCQEAKRRIRAVLGDDTCDIHFLVGGTQANLTLIAAALRPYEAVISADSGHIHVHETGSIEATGHKILAVPAQAGKVTCEAVEQVIAAHLDEHMVKPAMVYISNATEIGSYYTKQELTALHALCRQHGLYLFMDGARLGNALMAEDNDVSFHDLCELCDVFYIGGTKNGALFGEALVIMNNTLKNNFRYMIKQRGGLLAKGRLLGIQFATLFQAQLYEKSAAHANAMAQRLQQAFVSKGIDLMLVTQTNQIFPILTDTQAEILHRKYIFQQWERLDETHAAYRMVTSWATDEQIVAQCVADIAALPK